MPNDIMKPRLASSDIWYRVGIEQPQTEVLDIHLQQCKCYL